MVEVEEHLLLLHLVHKELAWMMTGHLCHKTQPSEPPFRVVLIEVGAESQQMADHEMVLDHHKLAPHVHTFDHALLVPVDIAEAFAVDFAAVVGVVVADKTGGAAGKVAVAVGKAAVVGRAVVADEVVVVDRTAVDKPLAVVACKDLAVAAGYKAVAVADRGVVAVVDKALTVAVADKALTVVAAEKAPPVAAADKALIVAVADKAQAVAVVGKAAAVVGKAVAVADTVVDRVQVVVVVYKAVVVDMVAVDDMVAAVVDKAVAVGSLDLAAVDSAVGMVAADHTEQVLVGEVLDEEAAEGVVLDHSFHFDLDLVASLVAQVPAKVQPLVLHGQPCRSKYTLKP